MAHLQSRSLSYEEQGDPWHTEAASGKALHYKKNANLRIFYLVILMIGRGIEEWMKWEDDHAKEEKGHTVTILFTWSFFQHYLQQNKIKKDRYVIA